MWVGDQVSALRYTHTRTHIRRKIRDSKHGYVLIWRSKPRRQVRPLIRMYNRFRATQTDSNLSTRIHAVPTAVYSIRIGRDTEADGCGYLEDRRPSSNADPYVVTGMIMETSMGPEAPVIEPLDRQLA